MFSVENNNIILQNNPLNWLFIFLYRALCIYLTIPLVQEIEEIAYVYQFRRESPVIIAHEIFM